MKEHGSDPTWYDREPGFGDEITIEMRRGERLLAIFDKLPPEPAGLQWDIVGLLSADPWRWRLILNNKEVSQ